ncbi:MAG: DUF4097 family beta strand repeat protein [Gemmatimonadaceae bacterium]|nr:DUF4097 family beta strand repeat protein [Gemmatimonadaceae bacterium]
MKPLAHRALALAILALGTTAALARPATAQGNPDFSWEGRIPRGRWLLVRNLNGAIRVERASGDKAEVTAEKRVRRGSGDAVRIEVKKGSNNDDILICAFWTNNASCDEEGYRSRGENGWNRRNEVSVEFTVRLPDGVKLVTSSVNGSLHIEGATSEVDASTMNGGITAYTNGGPVRATTVNGGIDVRMRDTGTEDLEFETVNGSVTIELPASLNADLDMRTVNGRVQSDFPLTISGRINPRHIRATIGKGGQRLKVSTVNGSVDIRKM